MQLKKKPAIAVCVEKAGHPTIGIVLYRLIFWKPTRQFGGRWWIAKPYEELMHETGLTIKQVKSSVAKLKAAGLIITSQHLFRGKNVLHILVTQKAHFELREVMHWSSEDYPEGTDQEDPTGAEQQSPEDTPQVNPTGTTHIHGVQHGVIHGVIHGESNDAVAGGEPVKAHELKAAFENATYIPGKSKALAKLHGKKPEASLMSVWQEAVHEATQGFAPGLTMVERGKLKHIQTKVGADRVKEVIRWAVLNWIPFVKAVEQDAGIKTTPAKPNIGFLLKYADVAVNRMSDTTVAPADNLTSVLAALEQKAAPAEPEVVEDAKPKSMDELLSLIGNKKNG